MSGEPFQPLRRPLSRRAEMGLPARLSESERRTAMEWRAAGVSVAGIARRLGSNVQAIYRLIRKAREAREDGRGYGV